MPKLLFFITEDWYFCSHRLPLAKAAVEAGYDVVVLTNLNSHEEEIASHGIRALHLPLQRRSMNPLRELMTLARVVIAYLKERPDIVHHVAMKPVLYGGVAALLVGIPRVVNALAGLGYLFISERPLARSLRACITLLFRSLLNRNNSRLILQNGDDAEIFESQGLVTRSRIRLIRGSGVDTALFRPTPEPQEPVRILLPARMLFDKGIAEYVEASRIVSQKGCGATFILVGRCDPENPAAVTEEELHRWEREGVVEWWGHCADMAAVLSGVHLVCLPSYREGLPKALLEAASCGRPIIATDVPGCREIVRNGVNGYLVRPRDSSALAAALVELIRDKKLREKMGAKGREMAMAEFAEQKVVAETMAVYRELLEG